MYFCAKIKCHVDIVMATTTTSTIATTTGTTTVTTTLTTSTNTPGQTNTVEKNSSCNSLGILFYYYYAFKSCFHDFFVSHRKNYL